jgi:hypothetical protein
MGLLQRVRSAVQRVRGEPAVSCTHLDQFTTCRHSQRVARNVWSSATAGCICECA